MGVNSSAIKRFGMCFIKATEVKGKPMESVIAIAREKVHNQCLEVSTSLSMLNVTFSPKAYALHYIG